ncbi:MAG: isochorismatase family protein [Sulfuricella sp.]
MKLFASILVLLLQTSLAMADTPPPTLLQIVGVTQETARLSNSVLVIIDAQREYVDGRLHLSGIEDSLVVAAKLLARARAAGTPVVHVVQRGGGALFNPQGAYFEEAAPLAAQTGEPVVQKTLPNAFAGTNLQNVLGKTGRKNLIVIGYMTHMCVSSTVRAALDAGYRTTVVAAATATRNLPDGHGGTISAATVQAASLAALSDRFAKIVQNAEDIPD